MAKDQPLYPEIGKRLLALRLAYAPDETQGAWASAHRFNKTRYNNWELGNRRIPVDEAELLCERYGLTLDWIYRSKIDGLSEAPLKKLKSHLPR